MVEEEKKEPTSKRIGESQRFKYIGFEVFPGKPKDLFSSDAEKEKMVKSVLEKRAKHDPLHALREECTLLERRVSLADRVILTVACLAVIASVFLPWYAAYNEVVVEPGEEPAVAMADSNLVADSTVLADSSMLSDTTLAVAGDVDVGTDSAVAAAAAASDSGYSSSASEEVIHGYVARKKVSKEYDRLSGVGTFAALGNVGSYVFSSGGILVVTAILFMGMVVLSILLPLYSLYGLFGLKGDPDQRALKLKKVLELNWLLPVVFVVALALSFVGAHYGFEATSFYSSIGDNYGPGVFLGTLSWGVFVALAGSILLAVKGVEI